MTLTGHCHSAAARYPKVQLKSPSERIMVGISDASSAPPAGVEPARLAVSNCGYRSGVALSVSRCLGAKGGRKEGIPENVSDARMLIRDQCVPWAITCRRKAPRVLSVGSG
jgi:hypothetical protein